MLSSIVTLAVRTFLRNISYSIISLGSLVVGITTAILLFLWVNHELGFNGTMPDRDRVYALLFNQTVDGTIVTEEGTSAPLMDFLAREVPEIESVTRVDNARMVLSYGNKSVQKQGVYADSVFFDVHPSPLLSGNSRKILPNNRSIAISKTTADLLFASNDALGKAVQIDQKTEFIVTAVFTPFPDNSNFSYIEFVLPYDAKVREADAFTNYDLKLTSDVKRAAVEEKINLVLSKLPDYATAKSMLFVLEDWRLHWSFENGKVSGGLIKYLVIFSVTGIFVLIMACINFVNISTARATKRKREVGVRKMTGATQRLLVRQFMTENMILVGLASVLSLMLAFATLPAFNVLIGTHLSISLYDPVLLAGLLVISVLVSLMAGSYPAFLLASLKPAVVLKGNGYGGNGATGMRKGLVIVQFSLSAVIIFCSIILWQQTHYLIKKDLGYDKQDIINVWLDGVDTQTFDNLRNSMLTHTAIESAAFSGASPMEVNGYADCNLVTSPFPVPMQFYGATIDEHTLATLRFELVQGRNFSRERASDSSNFIITQRAADLLGLQHPIGERITYNMYGPQTGEIVGVVKDFQNDDIHIAEKPVVFVFGKRSSLANLFIRYRHDQQEEAVTHIKSIFGKVQPGIPVNYSFLDADYDRQLLLEKRLGNMSIWFTVIAVVLACLGLFGLVIFTAQVRTREIGIRKVLGGSVQQMVVLLCSDFFKPVVYSLVVAFPLAYYLMNRFLEDYPSHITISFYTFVLTSAAMLAMVILTISYQSIKAAMQNPADSLKVE